MKARTEQALEKIESYARRTREFVEGYTYGDFIQDDKTIAACVFNLSQIGELVKVVEEGVKERYPAVPWHQLRGLRNRIVHDYEGVQIFDVWDVIERSLPGIERQMRTIREKEKAMK